MSVCITFKSSLNSCGHIGINVINSEISESVCTSSFGGVCLSHVGVKNVLKYFLERFQGLGGHSDLLCRVLGMLWARQRGWY